MKYIKLFEEDAHIDNGNGRIYWGSVGSGVLPYCKGTGRFLIQLRAAWVDEPHTWGIWGGAVKKNKPSKKDILDSAIMEFKEESAFKGKFDKIIKSYIYKDAKFSFYNYIAILDKEFKPSNINGDIDDEVEAAEWVDLTELLNHPNKHFGLQAIIDNNLKQLQSLWK